MQAQFFQKLRAGISASRLDVYRTPSDSDFEVIAKYLWNIALCEALYPALHALEIALRNTIHQAASDHYDDEHWFNPSTSLLHPWEQSRIAKAETELIRERKLPEPDRVVARLTFGFWVSLLDRRYERVFWPYLLRPAFPYMPRKIRKPGTLRRRFEELRILRNRVFHHERISRLPTLAHCHDDILETMDWINPGLRQVLASMDRFRQVYKNGMATVRDELGKVVYPSVNAYVI